MAEGRRAVGEEDYGAGESEYGTEALDEHCGKECSLLPDGVSVELSIIVCGEESEIPYWILH